MSLKRPAEMGEVLGSDLGVACAEESTRGRAQIGGLVCKEFMIDVHKQCAVVCLKTIMETKRAGLANPGT
jgi:hypothetical protein